jgi:2-keto-4-pentenoate hydratase/2-oxohepta-3-ene-1,7-dioic acid hydratase in catechol pathway
LKLVTYSPGDMPNERRVGALTLGESRVVPLKRAHEARTGTTAPAFSSMLDLIRAGGAGLEAARSAVEFAASEGAPELLIDLESVDLSAPLPDPVMLRCCSVFAGHYRNAHKTVSKWRTGTAPLEVQIPDAFYRIPGYYKGNPLSFIGPGATIRFPAFASLLDFELELAAILGEPGIDVPKERFEKHVFGYSIFNDASARHPQLEEMALGTGPNKSKDFDTGNVLGPCIVTPDEFDPRAAEGIARVNGVEWGRGHASDMAHDWGDILAYRSRSERLYPGEIVTSGCFTNCSGVEHDRFLNAGDVVELEIAGIGTLRNAIGKADS